MALGLDELQDALRAAGGRWNAAGNPLACLTAAERRRRFAYAPSLDEIGLRYRAAVARLRRARRPDLLAGSAIEVHDLRALRGRDFVGRVREPCGCSACAVATLTVVEVTLRIAAGDPRLALADRVLDTIDALPPRSTRPCEPPSTPTFELRGGARPAGHTCSRIHIRGWRELDAVDAMKSWIATRGPLIALFAVHEDFYAYTNGVYHYIAGAFEGGHHVAVIGFDDGGEYWIAQNSWGAAWGEDGFFRIGFGERGIDASMWGVELQ